MRELTTRLVRLGDLRPHPENANMGDVPAVRESLRLYGQWRPIVAQVREGEPLRVLIGHTMLRAAQAEGWDRIAVHERTCDDDEARRILAIDNRTRDRANTDEQALARLLDNIGDDLAGTAYDAGDRARLRALIETQDNATLRAMSEATRAERPVVDHEREPTPRAERTRYLTLAYPDAVHEWLGTQLDHLCDAMGLDSAAAVVLRLVEEAREQHAPGAEPEVAAPVVEPAAPAVDPHTSTLATDKVLPTAAESVAVVPPATFSG